MWGLHTKRRPHGTKRRRASVFDCADRNRTRRGTTNIPVALGIVDRATRGAQPEPMEYHEDRQHHQSHDNQPAILPWLGPQEPEQGTHRAEHEHADDDQHLADFHQHNQLPSKRLVDLAIEATLGVVIDDDGEHLHDHQRQPTD